MRGSKATTCCFVAGTLVATQAGSVPIEDIEEGDLVWARDVETGETMLKPVTELIRRHERQIWEVVGTYQRPHNSTMIVRGL